jgi:hypothetical protein
MVMLITILMRSSSLVMQVWRLLHGAPAGFQSFPRSCVYPRLSLIRRYGGYFMALMFLPAGGMVPAGVALLWVSNSCFSIAQVRCKGLLLVVER